VRSEAPRGGVRLYHPTARSGIFTFEHNKRPYRVPIVCVLCSRAHKVKTYHINVDHDGFAFVTHEIWTLMRQHNTAGFQLANEVGNPPALRVGFGEQYVPQVTPLEEN